MCFSRRSFLFMLLTFFATANLFALNVKGVSYMSTADLARLCAMRYSTISAGKYQTVFSKTSKLRFEENSRMITLNGVSVWLGYPVVESKGRLYFAKNDYAKTIRPILFPQQMGKPPNVFHIFIDAGHGGKDNGAFNKNLGLKEKSVVLDVAIRLGKILRQNGYRVTYSRTSDQFVELSDRTERANKVRANIFLSIHCNAATPSVTGIETYSMTPRSMPSTSSKTFSSSDNAYHAGNTYDGWDQLLSYYIQRDLISATDSNDRGVKRARFVVLRGSNMPSSLVEIGFLSNNSEAKKLATAKYRQRIADSLANSIMRYHSTIRRLQKNN